MCVYIYVIMYVYTKTQLLNQLLRRFRFCHLQEKQLDLEVTIACEISQTQKDQHIFLYLEVILKKKRSHAQEINVSQCPV
jgi:hypothetical protein